MGKNVFLSLVKTVVFSMMVMMMASCSGSSSKMTGAGIYGDLPNYLFKFIELKQKCAEDIEFEDNKDKRGNIEDKYAKQWEEMLPASKIEELCLKMDKDTIPVVSHVRERFSPVRMNTEGMRLDFEKGIKGNPCIVIRYDEKPNNGNMYFFLDANDSIVGVSFGMYQMGNTVAIPFGIGRVDLAQKEQVEINKVFLHLIDKAKKNLIPEGKDEINECVMRLEYSLKSTAKDLEDAGVIGHVDLDDEEKSVK